VRHNETSYEVPKHHIRNNRDAIDKLVDVLLEKETLSGEMNLDQSYRNLHIFHQLR
jgi:ATP-dependent Zn protease